MKLRTAIRVARSGDLGALLSLPRVLPPYYRVCFLAAAAQSGLLRRLAGGPVALERLADERVGDPALRDGLEAWLDLGAALGALRRGPGGYGLRGRLARALGDLDRDAVAALIEEAGAPAYSEPAERQRRDASQAEEDHQPEVVDAAREAVLEQRPRGDHRDAGEPQARVARTSPRSSSAAKASRSRASAGRIGP